MILYKEFDNDPSHTSQFANILKTLYWISLNNPKLLTKNTQLLQLLKNTVDEFKTMHPETIYPLTILLIEIQNSFKWDSVAAVVMRCLEFEYEQWEIILLLSSIRKLLDKVGSH